MIKNFHTYNGSLKDKMIGKELKGIHLEIFKAKNQLDSIRLKTSRMQIDKGIYMFSITNIMNININLHYHIYEEMKNKWSEEYLNKHKEGWNVYVEDFTADKRDDYLTGEWNTILKKIINICYPNIDDIIQNTKKEIEKLQIKIQNNENLLKGVENAKKIINNDD